ncbi:unnamed protein product [Diamesa tonsa]
MKVTLQWMLITVLLCLAHCIAASPYDNSKYLQEKYFSPKRTKPSLSIVNPLDVLRQRIMLEMARRQMRENTKQVEMNKAILKTIGKRDVVGRSQYFKYKKNTSVEDAYLKKLSAQYSHSLLT